MTRYLLELKFIVFVYIFFLGFLPDSIVMTESGVGTEERSEFRSRFLTNSDDVFKHNAWLV